MRTLRFGAICLVLVSLSVPFPASAEGTQAEQFTGSVAYPDDIWRIHKIQVGDGGDITAELDWDDAAADLDIMFKDPSGAQVAVTRGAARPEALSHPATTTGTWTIGVRARSGAASYQLQVDFPDDGTVDPLTYNMTIGGPGRAQMYPSGLDVDADGVVYVADTGGDRVQAYSRRGTLLWSVGDGRVGNFAGSFENPRDVAVAGGKVYVADAAYNRIQVLDAATGAVRKVWPRKIEALIGVSTGVNKAGRPIVLAASGTTNRIEIYRPGGKFIRSIGRGFGSGRGQMKEPRDAATDAAGRIYAADFKNHRVAVFSPKGKWLRSWGTHGNRRGQFKEPYGIDVDDAGRVYVADSNNQRLQRFTRFGKHVRTYGEAGTGPGRFFQLRRVAVGSGRRPAVYGADLWGAGIERFSFRGKPTFRYGRVLAPAGRFNEPGGLTVTPAGVVVADTSNQRIQSFRGETLTRVFGTRGWGANLSGFNWPEDVAFSTATDTLWVADTKNWRLLEFNRNGTPTGRTLGRRGDGAEELGWAYSITAVGRDLIVADTWNGRVIRWNPTSGFVWTATGLNYPMGVVESGGKVYVADTLNGRVVTLSAETGARLGTFGAGDLTRPEGVAVHPETGVVIVADAARDHLIRFAPDGTVLDRYGVRGSGPGQFLEPRDLEISCVQQHCQLYVSETGNHRVQVFDLNEDSARG